MELISWSKVPRNRFLDIDAELSRIIPAGVDSCHYLVFRLPDKSTTEVIHFLDLNNSVKTFMYKKA